MHKIIEQLAKQAGMVEYPTGLGIAENTLWGDRNIEKFAELLLEECTNLTLDYKNQSYYAGWLDYRDEIKRYFGIRSASK